MTEKLAEKKIIMMGQQAKQEKIKELLSTEEGREKLKRSMHMPVRCGGLDYIDGKPFYRCGGKLYTPEEFEKLCDSINESRIIG
jgi:hypothetical protein